MRTTSPSTGEPTGAQHTILTTKLHIPPLPADYVPRTNLLKRLEKYRNSTLKLVSAPAGYGKSILTSGWIKESNTPAAWISLDERDNDLRVFLSYLVAAMRRLDPELLNGCAKFIEAVEVPSVSVISETLINELDTVPERFILALDDYHQIEAEEIHELIRRLLRHPPQTMELVILTRRDPPLPLHDLRAHGRMLEVRLGELSFTREEISSFFQTSHGISLAEEASETLLRKTEGWVTGLRLAALSIAGPEDLQRLAFSIQGDSLPLVSQYLIQEVLLHQPPDAREYLLKTSILNRFSAELLDELVVSDAEEPVSRGNGSSFLEWLQKTGMFIIPLDMEHQWFRYHHLFQSLLAAQLRQERTPEEITALHLRASGWFERNRLIEESIGHALKAADAERALGIIERHRWDELNRDRWYVVQRWLSMLPPATEHRPELLFAEAWIHYERYQLGKIPPLLERITALLDGETEQPALWGELYFFRGALAFFEGNGESGKQFFEHARELLPRGENLIWGLIELLDALSRYTTGEKEPAIEALERRIQEATSHDSQFFSRLYAGLCFICYLMGDLHRARAYAQRLQSVAKSGQIAYTEAWSTYMQACTYLQAHELDQALRHFNAAFAQRYILHVRAAVDVIGGLSLTHQLMGQTDAATATMERLIEFAREMKEPAYLAVAASYRARLSLLQGNLEPAMEWAASASGRATPIDLFIWLENPFTTLARVWIAESSPENLEKATHLLERLREQSEACQYTCQAIEVAVLQSLACENQGETDKALTLLAGVVEQAVRLGWFRPFVEAGPPVAGLLRQLEKKGTAGVDLGTLLDACTADREQVQGSASEGRRAMVIAPSHGPTMPETEALTEREIEVVSLLAEGLKNREIASRLFLSPSTVKAHVYNIYQKWDVHSRVSVVDKAKKSGLID